MLIASFSRGKTRWFICILTILFVAEPAHANGIERLKQSKASVLDIGLNRLNLALQSRNQEFLNSYAFQASKGNLERYKSIQKIDGKLWARYDAQKKKIMVGYWPGNGEVLKGECGAVFHGIRSIAGLDPRTLSPHHGFSSFSVHLSLVHDVLKADKTELRALDEEIVLHVYSYPVECWGTLYSEDLTMEVKE